MALQSAVSKSAADLGESGVLECKVSAYPAPVMSWTLTNNRRIVREHDVKVTAEEDDIYTSQLSIKDVNEKDYRSYTCKAFNTRGETRVQIILQPKGKGTYSQFYEPLDF